MLVGDKAIFAIESEVDQYYERPSFLGLGFFVVYISGYCYGVRSVNATLLACSFDEVKRRHVERGNHSAPFATEKNGHLIARAFREAIYHSNQENRDFFGLSCEEFTSLIYSRRLMWIPDGDEAFDDGSFVLQFDVGQNVRLIAFKSQKNSIYDPETFMDVVIDADIFYKVLGDWYETFYAGWLIAKKSGGSDREHR